MDWGAAPVRILGIDPGIARLGWGVVESCGPQVRAIAFGCVETPPRQAEPERLQKIFLELTDIIRSSAPTCASVEQLFFYRNTTTAFRVGQARGVALLAAVNAGLDVHEYTPMQVKQAVTGYGSADKRQIQEMVRVLLGLREVPRPDDAADALAVAITHAHSIHWTTTARPGKDRNRT
jgi:crossover junction endodeoxyribonuclease RuvC